MDQLREVKEIIKNCKEEGKIMLIPKQTFKFFYNVIKFHEREQCS